MSDIEWIRESNLIEDVIDVKEDVRSLDAWHWFKQQHLTEETILKLHGKIMRKQLGARGAGRFRNLNVTVGGRICPHWTEIKHLMKVWMDKNSIADTELTIRVAHIRFESIHPFIDGNGRTGRMIMNYQMVKAGLEPVLISSKERWKYYEWFDELIDA